MKRRNMLPALLLAGLCLTVGAPAVAAPGVEAQQLPQASEPNVIQSYVTQSSDELWSQFYTAEASKKLAELQLEPLREQIRLLERPAGLWYYGYGEEDWSAQYETLTQLKAREYELKLQKEQYEWDKKNAEYQLTLLGEIQKPHELQYQLYLSGSVDLSLESALSLQQKKEALKLQEELLELDKKNLEYQYKLGQLADTDFLSQYAALLEEKQGLKEQRELLDAQLKLYDELLGPGALGPKGPLGP